MQGGAPSPQASLTRQVLVVVLVLGMVLALVAGAFAPALPGSAVVTRVGTLVVGALCALGLIVLLRPRGSADMPGARPHCPQCGQDLTEVRAGVSGRTTCPACEMTWALPRDRAVWEKDASAPAIEGSGAAVPGPGPVAGRVGGARSSRRARRRVAARWTVIFFVYFFVAALVVPFGWYFVPSMSVQHAINAALVIGFLLPGIIVVAGVFAWLRAGRASIAQPCPSCGYDLTGLDRTRPGGAACPGCGAGV
ncbi:MAG: hypothetical protein RIE77_09340 [Phycisphaerales bacterium]|jgi:uncharacterized Zn finger protein (UPF0148 family)